MKIDDFKGKNNIVLIGESGSGKTEIALCLATKYFSKNDCPSAFFDMDQTKGLFRSRDFRHILNSSGFELKETTSFLDVPVVPAGVTGSLLDPRSINIFDVGGNEIGARMIGQFQPYLHEECTKVLYIINPYRYVRLKGHEVVERMSRILSSCRLHDSDFEVVSNPCLGNTTTVADVVQGHELLKQELSKEGYYPTMLAVEESLSEEVKNRVEEPILALKLHIQYP